MSNFIAGLFMSSNISFFSVIDKETTLKNCKEKMRLFQESWRKTHKSGGIASSTHDVLHALLSCIAPTMEDIKTNQPQLFKETCEKGNFFAFVYWQTLATKINNCKDAEFNVLKLHKKTIYNQINRLIECGIISEKRNYNKRGNKGHENPILDDLNPNGRGKIQLFINPEVLVFKPQFCSNFAPTMQTLQQYTASCLLKDKELETIIDNAPNVDNAVSANADDSIFNVKNKEQERINQPTIQISAPQLSKKDFLLLELFVLAKAQLYPGREFNTMLEQASYKIIDNHLKQISVDIQAFKSEKIKGYTSTEKYQAATSNTQIWMLKKYREKLPNTDKAAVEVLSYAFQKQAKNAKNNGYLHRLGYPPDFLVSNNFQKAIDYSLSDWKKIQNNYFAKNQRFGSYFLEVGKIGKIYTSILDIASESIVHAYPYAVTAYQNFINQLQQNLTLTDSNKLALSNLLKDKFTPIFKKLTLQEKKHLLAS